MATFTGISFMWTFIIMGGISLVFAVRAYLSWLTVRRDAAADYDYKHANGMLPGVISRETYEAIYRRVYAPRAALYVAGGMLAILLLTPVAMVIFEVVLNWIYNLSGQDRAIEPGFLVWQSFLFFGMIMVWIGIGYVVARRYHQTTYGTLQYELDQHLYGGDQ